MGGVIPVRQLCKKITLGLTMLAAIVLFAPGAHADTYDPVYPNWWASWTCPSLGNSLPANGLFCKTDNSGVYYYRQGNLSAQMTTAVESAVWDSYETTDLSFHWDSTPTYSGSARTDIIYQQYDTYDANILGATWCASALDATRCDGAIVRFRPGQTSRALACHETGHAVGLLHGDRVDRLTSGGVHLILDPTNPALGCMVTPLNTDLYYMGTMNYDGINANY